MNHDYIAELIDSAENGDTESAQTLMEIFHNSFYSSHESNKLLIGADGVNYPDPRILAYMARCMKPILSGEHKDANKALNLTSSQRGRKETKQAQLEKKYVWHEVNEERKRIRATQDKKKHPDEPLTQAIDRVAESRFKSPDTIRKDYDKVNREHNNLWARLKKEVKKYQ